MKAIVKATGDIVEVDQCSILYDDGRRELMYGKELDEVEGAPDYWEKLKHQAAISAMHGLVGNSKNSGPVEGFVEHAICLATALVEKLKGEKV